MSIGQNILICHSFMDLWVWIMAWVPWPQLLAARSCNQGSCFMLLLSELLLFAHVTMIHISHVTFMWAFVACPCDQDSYLMSLWFRTLLSTCVISSPISCYFDRGLCYLHMCQGLFSYVTSIWTIVAIICDQFSYLILFWYYFEWDLCCAHKYSVFLSHVTLI